MPILLLFAAICRYRGPRAGNGSAGGPEEAAVCGLCRVFAVLTKRLRRAVVRPARGRSSIAPRRGVDASGRYGKGGLMVGTLVLALTRPAGTLSHRMGEGGFLLGPNTLGVRPASVALARAGLCPGLSYSRPYRPVEVRRTAILSTAGLRTAGEGSTTKARRHQGRLGSDAEPSGTVGSVSFFIAVKRVHGGTLDRGARPVPWSMDPVDWIGEKRRRTRWGAHATGEGEPHCSAPPPGRDPHPASPSVRRGGAAHGEVGYEPRASGPLRVPA